MVPPPNPQVITLTGFSVGSTDATENKDRRNYVLSQPNIQMTPPRIIHGSYRPADKKIPAIIDKVKEIIGLRSREYKLLLYYAMSKGDFSPALKRIQDVTGIDQSDVKEVRNSLQKMNLIHFVCNEYFHFIFVNWVVIRGFAMLEKPLKVGGPGRKNFTPCDFSLFNFHPGYKPRIDYSSFLGNLTQSEIIGMFDHIPPSFQIKGKNIGVGPSGAYRHMNNMEMEKRKELKFPSDRTKINRKDDLDEDIILPVSDLLPPDHNDSLPF